MMLSGRTALVTGGGRGIGRAIALSLATHGATVVVTGRRETALKEVAAVFGGTYFVMDVADRTATDSALQAIADKVGAIDILVNNAGIAESASLERTTDDTWDRMMEINVTAPFRLCRALAPSMVHSGFGRIINVASNAGRTGYPYTAAYCASKHALVGLTRAMAVDLAKTAVTVNAVCPGWVDTQMVTDAAVRIADKTGRTESEAKAALSQMSPQRRLMAPEEIAHLVVSLCAEHARGIHGQAIVLDGGQVMA